MRMTASWSGSNDPTAYKSVARRCTPMASSPRILNRPTDRHRPDTEAMQKARLAVHRRSACSGVKALRNTSDARRQAAKLCYRFGPLTPSARSANLIAGDGTKNGFPAPNKELATNQKRPLDRKSPIQVRIRLPSSGQSVSRPQPLSSVENPGFPRGCARLAWRPGRQRRAGCFDIAPTGGNISAGPYSSTAVRADGVGENATPLPTKSGVLRVYRAVDL